MNSVEFLFFNNLVPLHFFPLCPLLSRQSAQLDPPGPSAKLLTKAFTMWRLAGIVRGCSVIPRALQRGRRMQRTDYGQGGQGLVGMRSWQLDQRCAPFSPRAFIRNAPLLTVLTQGTPCQIADLRKRTLKTLVVKSPSSL